MPEVTTGALVALMAAAYLAGYVQGSQDAQPPTAPPPRRLGRQGGRRVQEDDSPTDPTDAG